MAAGIGMDAGQREADLVSGTSVQVMEALINLLRALASKKEYSFSDVDDKGMKAITDHIRQGGKVCQSIVDTKDAASFEKALKAYHIPFAQVAWQETNGRGKRVYFTRDGSSESVRKVLPSDARRLEKAWKMFALRLREGLGEVTIQDFLKAADGQEAVRLCGLSTEERELFGKQMAGRTGSYAFADGEETGTTDVLYLKKDEEQVTQAFTDVCYIFSGKKGAEYREKVREELLAREAFYKDALPEGHETVFIVDAEKPNEFIAVTETGFSVHSIQIRKNGQKEVCEDRGGRLYPTHSELMRSVEGLQKPVILQAEDFPLIKGFSRDGKAEALESQEAKEIYTKLRETLADKPYYRGITENVELLKDTEGKRKVLYNVHSPGDAGYEKLDDRQREALSRVLEKRTEEMMIDRAMTEKVMDTEYSNRAFHGRRLELER